MKYYIKYRFNKWKTGLYCYLVLLNAKNIKGHDKPQYCNLSSARYTTTLLNKEYNKKGYEYRILND